MNGIVRFSQVCLIEALREASAVPTFKSRVFGITEYLEVCNGIRSLHIIASSRVAGADTDSVQELLMVLGGKCHHCQWVVLRLTDSRTTLNSRQQEDSSLRKSFSAEGTPLSGMTLVYVY